MVFPLSHNRLFKAQQSTINNLFSHNNELIMTNSLCCELPTQWEECVNKIIEREEYTKFEIIKRQTSTNGGNYIGILYEVNVKGETKNGKKETNLFVKNIIPNSDSGMFSVSDMYKAELFVYKDLFKVFEELQDIYNVPKEERNKTAKSYDESHTESLIMENLSLKGYTTYDRMDIVSLQFAELSMKAIAKFHALGFVLKEKRPDYFKTNIMSREYGIKDMTEYIKAATNTFMKILDEDSQMRVQRKFEDIGDAYLKLAFDESSVRTLCHGDFRPNNILTHFKDDEVTEIIPIDYQLIYYGSPVMDVIFYMFLCTDREFRKAHLTHLKDVYHDTMGEFLKYFNMDINLVFSKEVFLKSFEEKLDAGLILSLITLPLLYVSDDCVPDLVGDISDMEFVTQDGLKPRLLGAVQEFIEWGRL